MDYFTRSDEDAERIVMSILNSSSNVEQVRERLNHELKYGSHFAITQLNGEAEITLIMFSPSKKKIKLISSQ